MEIGPLEIGAGKTQGLSDSPEYHEKNGSKPETDDRKVGAYSKDQVEEFVASLEAPGIGDPSSCHVSDEETRYAVFADLKPPGDCFDPEKYERLRDEVNRACKRPIGCQKTDSEEVIFDKIDKIGECIAARKTMNATCFRGGNPVHRDSVKFAVAASINCWDIISRRQEHWSRSPGRTPKDLSRELWENAAKVTGLSGAALVGYLILSEGSRIFPPRNLVPVP